MSSHISWLCTKYSYIRKLGITAEACNAAASPTAVPLKPAAAGAPLPGIFKITRHPVLWGIGLWAFVHVMANGDVASLIFFGSLGVLALGGTVHIDRKKRATGGGDWRAFAGATSNVPFAAIVAGRTRVSLKEIGYGRLAAGVVLYMVLLLGHEAVIGVAPLVS